MVRTAQAEPVSKEKLLDAAEELMLAKGFEATSVEEICESAGLTKGSFFHYFESKDQLGMAVLERFCRNQQERMRSAPFNQKKDPLDRIEGMLDFMIQMDQTDKKSSGVQQGCLLGTFAQELAATHPEIRSCCADQFRAWAKGLQRELDAARALHVPKSSLDTRSLADHFISVLEGSLILAKAKRDPDAVAESIRHLKRYVLGLFGKRPQEK